MSDNSITNQDIDNTNTHEKESTSSTSSTSSSLFKKKVKNKTLRKNIDEDTTNDTTESPKSDEQQQPTEDLTTIIEITKERQKLREKGKGINVGVLAEGPHIKAHLRELEHKLDDSFTVATEKKDTNVHLEKFLQVEMEKKKIEIKQKLTGVLVTGTNTDGDNNNNDDDSKKDENSDKNTTTTITKSDEDSLYETPEHLIVKKSRKKDEDKTNWLAGISEVNLPQSYKIKNIQETENARAKLHETKQQQYKDNQQHHHLNQQQQHHRFTRQYNDRNEKATDEEVYERFKKRFRG